MRLRTPFPYEYVLIVIIISKTLLCTCFVLSSEMMQIADGPITTFTFIVILIQKQYINFSI